MNPGIEMENAATPRPERLKRLERRLAGLLHYGTWLASAVTALGLAVAWLESGSGALSSHGPAAFSGMRLVTAGIALFILLPVSRVVLMLAVFLRERDYLFALIAAVVLLIIALGLVLGICLPPHS